MKTLREKREPTTNSTQIWHPAGLEQQPVSGGERSRHCATPAPFSMLAKLSHKENVAATCPRSMSPSCAIIENLNDHLSSRSL